MSFAEHMRGKYRLQRREIMLEFDPDVVLPFSPISRREVTVDVTKITKRPVRIHEEERNFDPDDYVPMPPISRYTVKARIRSIKKGKPTLYEEYEEGKDA